MAKQLNPQARVVNGRTVVNRDWIQQRTGAKHSTVEGWYAKREQQPEEVRHPEKGPKIDRADYYDLEGFLRFFNALQERKRSAILPTDPELYTGSPNDRISINDAAKLFRYAGPASIRKYLAHNPGYFPEPVGTVVGPSGRPIPAFRRGDLQKFDQDRSGVPVGAGTGRQPEPSGTARPSPKAQRRFAAALEHMERSGGWYRGVATELARRHGELTSLSSWKTAVQNARAELEAQADQRHSA